MCFNMTANYQSKNWHIFRFDQQVQIANYFFDWRNLTLLLIVATSVWAERFLTVNWFTESERDNWALPLKFWFKTHDNVMKLVPKQIFFDRVMFCFGPCFAVWLLIIYHASPNVSKGIVGRILLLFFEVAILPVITLPFVIHPAKWNSCRLRKVRSLLCESWWLINRNI